MEWIKEYKEKAEIHRHLEGSIPVELIWKHRSEICPGRFSKIEDLRNHISQIKPMENLQEVLDKFDIFQKAFKNCGPNFTFECTKEVIRKAYEEEGIKYLDLRFSPHFMCPEEIEEKRGYPEMWDHHMKSILEAILHQQKTQEQKIKIGLIVIVSRNYGPESGIMTAKFCKKWRESIHGFDFAASELSFPIKDFLPTVKLVHEMKLPLTVHSGEGVDPKYIKETLDLYSPVRRLGHAYTLFQDEELMERCIKEDICIECCPFSNWITNCGDIKDHPVKKLIKRGVPCCLNTDDPGLFQTDLNMEWEIAMKEIGFDKEVILKLNENAKKYSFCYKK